MFKGRHAELYKQDFVALEDGFFYYWPKTNLGALSEYDLKNIADLLTWVNQPSQEHLNKYLDNFTKT